MLLLAIDTAGTNCAVAVARGNAGRIALLARSEARLGRGHAERLMPMIEAVLRDANVEFDALERIAVTTGPGSFTGVRVGVAAARGLALALDIPAVGIGSLAALALPVIRTHRSGTAVAALDAKRDEIYAFARNLGSSTVIFEAGATRPQALADALAAATPPFVLIGAGASLAATALRAHPTAIVSLAEFPDIADVAELGFSAAPVAPPAPLYARGADAKPQADKALARQ